MVRNVKKNVVAALAIERGYLNRLIAGAGHSNEQISGVCQYFVTWLTDPACDIIDVDTDDWQNGRLVLIDSGLFSAAECDEIESLYVTPTAWTYVSAVADGPDRWLLVFASGTTQRSVTYHGNDPEGYAKQIEGTL